MKERAERPPFAAFVTERVRWVERVAPQPGGM